MLSLSKRKKRFLTGLVSLSFAIGCLYLCSGCGRGKETSEKSVAEERAESFTFFGLGANTVLTEEIRENLSEELGSSAVATRTTIDLAINYRGFLQNHFNSLYKINKGLNSETGERIEHDTLKLTFRYAQRKGTPFYYVELLFSSYAKTPLYFKIKAKAEGAYLVDTLKEKYGEPARIEWETEEGESLHWEKNGDVMILSKVPDRLGNPEYHIMIYYVRNLNDLLDREKKEAERREIERKKAGETAF
jgi:hypothetical protein